ncbi:MAG: hypothetical protein EA369_00270 [Bradymonadales bacterium]|nr:MAG: hypothetical protein EA369_00270 [Bradymonadales bacterium]
MKFCSLGISDSELHEMIRQLQFRYAKWDIHVAGKKKITHDALAISPEEHEHLIFLSRKISRLLEKIELNLKKSPEFLESLGIPAEVFEIIAVEPPSPFQIARYDYFKTTDGRWILSEFNEDVPGGFNEAVGVTEFLSQYYPDSLPSSFADHFMKGMSRFSSVALSYATGYSEDLQHMLILEKLLNRAGISTVRCAPSHIRCGWRRVSALGTDIDAVIRFYPSEWFPHLPNLAHWKRVLTRINMINPLSRIIRQSKNLFFLWESFDFLSREEKDFILSLTPRTHPVGIDIADEARHNREVWVLKHAFGRMGDSVVIGKLVTQEVWEGALKEALTKTGEFSLQEFFATEALVHNQTHIYPTVGVYLVNGDFGGYYSRSAIKPFFTHEANYVPTLVTTA